MKNIVKNIANSPKNTRITSRKINNAKRSRTNSEFVEDTCYLESKNINLPDDGKKQMLKDGKRSERFVNGELGKEVFFQYQLDIGHDAGKSGAKTGAIIGGGMSVIHNLVEMARGNKNAEEAAEDITKETASAVAVGYGTGFIGTNLQIAMSSSSNKILNILSETGLPSQIVVIAMETGKTLNRYISGEINSSECLKELGEKGTGMLTSSVGTVVGQAIIPVPIVGGIIGGMIGYTFSTAYYNELVNSISGRELAIKERISLEIEAQKAKKAIRQYRKEIQNISEKYFNEYTLTINNALSTMSEACKSGDADKFISGANLLTDKFGGCVQYRNMQEFEEFMNDENTDFLL